MDEQVEKEIERLNFENILWIIFIVLSLLNIRGDHDDQEFLRTNNPDFQEESNRIFTFTLFVTLFIYLYFFERNFKNFEKIDESQKSLYLTKVLGSVFLIVGVVLLLYFQIKQTSFVGSPAI